MTNVEPLSFNDPNRYGSVLTQQPAGLGEVPGTTSVDGVTVRTLRDTPEDAAFASRLMVEAFRPKLVHAVGEHNLPILTKGMTTSYYSNQEPPFYTKVFVAEYNGRLAGMAQLKFHADKDKEEMDVCEMGCCAVCGLICFEMALNKKVSHGRCLLDALAVEDGYRGRGIGKVLMDRAEHEARQRQCSCIYLCVMSTNRAKSLYERQGYKVTSEETCCGCLRCAIGYKSYYKMEKPLV